MKIYKIFQALSLDVVVGVNLLTVAIGKYYGVAIPWHILLELSIAIWLIYTADHLWDALQLKTEASAYRHRFHKKHRVVLLVICVAILSIGVVNLRYLPPVVLYSGLVLSLLTLVYYLILQACVFWGKELCVATIYTGGAFLAPIALSEQSLGLQQWLLIPQIFLMAFGNLLLFSWFEVSNDRRDGYPSMVIRIGFSRIETTFKRLVITGFLICAVVLLFDHRTSTLLLQLVFAAMFLILRLIFNYSVIFRQHDLYRIAGDGIFFLPFIYILYAR